MGNLDGKGAIVTGGSRGIGRAIVLRLAAEGATVMFSYLSNQQAAEEVIELASGRAHAVRADQGSMRDLRRLLAEAQERLPGLDIVVCNGEGGPLPGPIDDVTEEMFDQAIAVNVKGPFFLIQEAGRRVRDGGRIIAISTLNTRIHSPHAALYSGGKGAVENIIKCAALAYGEREITANIVSPGATDTELLRKANPGVSFEGRMANTALGRLGQPDDIAKVVAFLAGPEGGWVNGQNIGADGGMFVLPESYDLADPSG